jgi:hypothetical protein
MVFFSSLIRSSLFHGYLFIIFQVHGSVPIHHHQQVQIIKQQGYPARITRQGILSRKNEDATGEAFMYPLLMLLEDCHLLFRNPGDIPVSNYYSSASGFKHPVYLRQCLIIQVVHGVGFFNTDRLAVRKIRYDCIERSGGKRETGCISEKEIGVGNILTAARYHQWIKITSYSLQAKHLRLDQDSPGSAKWIKHDAPGPNTG